MRSTCSPSPNSGEVLSSSRSGSQAGVVAGGDPNVLTYVSIGTVPMGWRGRSVLYPTGRAPHRVRDGEDTS